MCETYENVKQTCIKRDVDVYWERRMAWESDGDGDGGGDGHADGDQNVVKNIYKSYRMCRFLPPPRRQRFFFQNLR